MSHPIILTIQGKACAVALEPPLILLLVGTVDFPQPPEKPDIGLLKMDKQEKHLL